MFLSKFISEGAVDIKSDVGNILSDFVFLCLCLLTHIWSVLFPIIS